MPECLSCHNELDEDSLTTAACSKCAHLVSPCGCTELAWTTEKPSVEGDYVLRQTHAGLGKLIRVRRHDRAGLYRKVFHPGYGVAGNVHEWRRDWPDGYWLLLPELPETQEVKP